MTAALRTHRHDYRLQTADSRPGATNRLARLTVAFVLAGGRGARLKQLTDFRAKPAVPFAGQLKIIDFSLSNCVNSGIRRIAVLTCYRQHCEMAGSIPILPRMAISR